MSTGRDGRTARGVLGHVQTQVQAHLGLGLALSPPQSPMHARQGGEEAAVLYEPPAARRAGRAGGGGQVLGQLGEDFGQQRRVQHGLGFGETALAHGPGADFFLDPPQAAGGAETAQGAHYGVEQAEEKEAEVIRVVEFAYGVAPGGAQRHTFGGLGEPGLEIFDQPPAGEVLVGQLDWGRSCFGYAANKAARRAV